MLGQLGQGRDVPLWLWTEIRLIVLLRVYISLVFLGKRLCLGTVELARLGELALSLANKRLQPSLMRQHLTLLIGIWHPILIDSLKHP